MHVPLPISPGRDGTQPSIALAYDSGQGHSPFGIGWKTDVPNITRRTDKGIPRYVDNDESDIFILFGQEDLVPVLRSGTEGWTRASWTDGEHRVDAYRPRVEGLFSRVERRTHLVTGDVHWRSITSDNVASVFGLTAGARIADPMNPLHVFQWLLEATFDDRGNATLYQYKAEDLEEVSASDPSEVTRFADPPANTYLKRVFYGNTTPLTTRDPSAADLGALQWYFELVFDYGEHATDLPAEVRPWRVRLDPYSTYRSGFEIRTYRLCERVLMFHRFPSRLGAPVRLVKSLELTYESSPTVTYLTRARTVGYARDASSSVTTAFSPSLKFEYTRVRPLSTTVQSVDPASLAGMPAGIDGATYQLVDLDGEGISGVLTAPATPSPALQYKRNLGGGRFAVAERLSLQPAVQAMGPGLQLASLNADGRLDVVQHSGPAPGFYERNRKFGWDTFRPFISAPRVDYARRGVHFLDLDGG